jgi:tetratricopeptide (TPR) repeat protein
VTVNRKYVIALMGLVAGFFVSFLWTQSINKNNAAPPTNSVASGMPGGAAGATGSGGQQAMMGQVQQVIEKAKSNPNDFQAQIEAAKVFNQVGRKAETAEYLKKAYDVNAVEFVKRCSTDLQGALPFIAMYYDEQKNYDESDRWIRRALDAAPNDNEMRIELAAAYLQREPPQPDKAIQELLAELKSNPKDGHALGHLVEAYALKKDVRNAEDAFDRLKTTDPANQRIAALETMVADLKAGKAVNIPKE